MADYESVICGQRFRFSLMRFFPSLGVLPQSRCRAMDSGASAIIRARRSSTPALPYNLPLQCFEPIHLAFDNAAAPLFRDGRLHCQNVPSQSAGEILDQEDSGRVRSLDPTV